MTVSLLHLDSSAHRSESVTRRLSGDFAARWRARHREGRYRYRDVAAHPVAALGDGYCELGRRIERRGLPPGSPEKHIATADERREWDLTRPLVEELVDSDVVVIGAPMYNDAAPAALKAWIDRISFPGVFTGVDDGSSRLANLRVIVVSACGGRYQRGAPAADRDFLTPYLRAWFVKQGVPSDRIEVVTAQMTLAAIVPGREDLAPSADRSLDQAGRRLRELADSL